MSVVRAIGCSVVATLVAVALAGCVRSPRPTIAPQPASLDSQVYGEQRGVIVAAKPGYGPPRKGTPFRDYDEPYRLDTGDRLRVVVYGQDGLTNTYSIDAAGMITLPLIGVVPARNQTPASLSKVITAKLRNGFIREPSVAVEVESYRPFFILGEVAAPGQYPYVPNMSVESAIAVAGGFGPRAKRDEVIVTHVSKDGPVREVVPLGTPITPGDTIQVGERWF